MTVRYLNSVIAWRGQIRGTRSPTARYYRPTKGNPNIRSEITSMKKKCQKNNHPVALTKRPTKAKFARHPNCPRTKPQAYPVQKWAATQSAKKLTADQRLLTVSPTSSPRFSGMLPPSTNTAHLGVSSITKKRTATPSTVSSPPGSATGPNSPKEYKTVEHTVNTFEVNHLAMVIIIKVEDRYFLS